MLKPTDAWKWYFDPTLQSLMLDLGEEMVFRV
ncbi:MAG: cell division protein ZapC, partial [Enterovibrio sp.]